MVVAVSAHGLRPSPIALPPPRRHRRALGPSLRASSHRWPRGRVPPEATVWSSRLARVPIAKGAPAGPDPAPRAARQCANPDRTRPHDPREQRHPGQRHGEHVTDVTPALAARAASARLSLPSQLGWCAGSAMSSKIRAASAAMSRLARTTRGSCPCSVMPSIRTSGALTPGARGSRSPAGTLGAAGRALGDDPFGAQWAEATIGSRPADRGSHVPQADRPDAVASWSALVHEHICPSAPPARRSGKGNLDYPSDAYGGRLPARARHPYTWRTPGSDGTLDRC